MCTIRGPNNAAYFVRVENANDATHMYWIYQKYQKLAKPIFCWDLSFGFLKVLNITETS